MKTLVFYSIAVFFEITLYMYEVSSWFRIYEMFQFNSFHMYEVIGSALFFGVIITYTIKKLKIKSVLDNSPISISNNEKAGNAICLGG